MRPFLCPISVARGEGLGYDALDMSSEAPGMAGPKARFDRQARDFDRRAGLPEGVGLRIARAVAMQAPEIGTWLEIGAGTGQIGQYLCRYSATFPGPEPTSKAPRASANRGYLGMDLSAPMLRLFARRIGADPSGSPGPWLARADADAAWPVRDASLGLVFASRVAHLLDARHLAAELGRTAADSGAIFLFGRVRRAKDSVRSVLRRELHELLREQGLEALGKGAGLRRIETSLEAFGGAARSPVLAASWQTQESPAQALASWRSKSGLAGQSLPTHLQTDILHRLTRRAQQIYGDLESLSTTEDSYELLPFALTHTE